MIPFKVRGRDPREALAQRLTWAGYQHREEPVKEGYKVIARKGDVKLEFSVGYEELTSGGRRWFISHPDEGVERRLRDELGNLLEPDSADAFAGERRTTLY